jgi:hypothetical protein
MIRKVETRLSKLEAIAVSAVFPRWHRVIGDSAKECEATRASLIAASKASRHDNFIFRVIVSA